jgi:hypothetical protein
LVIYMSNPLTHLELAERQRRHPRGYEG